MPSFARARLVAAALLLSSACGYTQVQQSSLVPLPQMSPPTSLHGRGDIYLGDSVVTHIGAPDLRPSSNAGLWIPRHQLDAAGSIRLSRFFSLRLLGGVGLSVDATPAAPTTLENPGGVAGWGGVGSIFHYLDASGFGLDVELDTMMATAPSLLRSRFCDPDGTCGEWSTQRVTDTVPLLGGTARFYYVAADWITVYGGLSIRNHPTNDAAFTSYAGTSSLRMGDPVLIIGMGAELTIASTVSFIPHVSWPAVGGPVSYGPIFGLAVRVHLGDGPGDQLPPWTHDDDAQNDAPVVAPPAIVAPPAPPPKPELTPTMYGGQPLYMR